MADVVAPQVIAIEFAQVEVPHEDVEDKFDDPNLPGDIQVTVTLKKVSVPQVTDFGSSIDDRGLAPPPVIYGEPLPLFNSNRGADSSPRDTYGLGDGQLRCPTENRAAGQGAHLFWQCGI